MAAGLARGRTGHEGGAPALTGGAQESPAGDDDGGDAHAGGLPHAAFIGSDTDVAPCAGKKISYIQEVTPAFVLALSLLAPNAEPTPERLSCGTLAVRDFPALAGANIGFGARPVVVATLDSALHPIRVHRNAGAPDALAALVLREADLAWVQQVDGAGFAAPLADDVGFPVDVGDGGDARLDIYLTALDVGTGALTISGGSANQRPVFIEIDPNQPEDLIVAATHHEFQHALQFAVDAKESAMWFESNAVAWEVMAHPEIGAWLELVPDFQAQPQAPVFTDSAAFAPFATVNNGTYEYGAALFVLYLDREYGDGDGRFLQRLWAASAQAGDENEPDWQDALGAETDLAAVIADFGGWRSLSGTLDVPDRGADDGPDFFTDGRSTVGGRSIQLASLTGRERTTDTGDGPFIGGCSLHTGTAPFNLLIPLRIEAASVDGHDLVAIATVVDLTVLPEERTARRSQSAAGASVALDVDVPAGSTVVAGVCDVTVADADEDPVFAPVRLRLSRTDVPAEGEGESTGEGEGEGVEGEGEGDGPVDCGCCCQDTGNPMSMRRNISLLAFFGGVFAFGVKAWRHIKRRRLYTQSPTKKT